MHDGRTSQRVAFPYADWCGISDTSQRQQRLRLCTQMHTIVLGEGYLDNLLSLIDSEPEIRQFAALEVGVFVQLHMSLNTEIWMLSYVMR